MPLGQLNNETFNNKNQESINDIESKIPTEEIKNRVLFSDAIEKSVKNPKTSNKLQNEESESESDDDYSDVEEDSEE